jgi:Holliday junction resolvasome RuvABC endonuclease subunit
VDEVTYYLGLDCSSKAIHGVIINDNEEIIKQYKWTSKNKESEQRLLDFGREFLTEFSTIRHTLLQKNGMQAAVESAIFIQNPKATIAIASVVGVVRFICMLNEIECCFVDNTKWKRQIVGKGNCSKQDIKAFAVEKWGDIFAEQDYADAACIALWKKQEENRNEF